jgi:hypothetical protein
MPDTSSAPLGTSRTPLGGFVDAAGGHGAITLKTDEDGRFVRAHGADGDVAIALHEHGLDGVISPFLVEIVPVRGGVEDYELIEIRADVEFGFHAAPYVTLIHPA